VSQPDRRAGFRRARDELRPGLDRGARPDVGRHDPARGEQPHECCRACPAHGTSTWASRVDTAAGGWRCHCASIPMRSGLPATPPAPTVPRRTTRAAPRLALRDQARIAATRAAGLAGASNRWVQGSVYRWVQRTWTCARRRLHPWLHPGAVGSPRRRGRVPETARAKDRSARRPRGPASASLAWEPCLPPSDPRWTSCSRWTAPESRSVPGRRAHAQRPVPLCAGPLERPRVGARQHGREPRRRRHGRRPSLRDDQRSRDLRVFRVLRAAADVVLIGAGTARAEGYTALDVRRRWPPRAPPAGSAHSWSSR